MKVFQAPGAAERGAPVKAPVVCRAYPYCGGPDRCPMCQLAGVLHEAISSPAAPPSATVPGDVGTGGSTGTKKVQE